MENVKVGPVLFVGLTLSWAASGCGEAAGAGGAPDAGTDAGLDGGGRSCGEAHVCVSHPGPGWDGPVALADPVDGCGAEYPDEAAALFDEHNVDEASCGCTCGDSVRGSCSSDMRVLGFAQISCGDPQGFDPISSLECYDTSSISHSVSFPPATAICEMGTATRDIPAPGWTRSYVACGGHTPGDGACEESQACVPRPGFGFNAGICYSRSGDEACPAAFPNKLLLHTGFSDTRRCPQTCDCIGVDALCEVSVTRYELPGCEDPLNVIKVVSGSEECVAPTSSTGSITLASRLILDRGACEGEELSVEGAVTETGTTTFCCN